MSTLELVNYQFDPSVTYQLIHPFASTLTRLKLSGVRPKSEFGRDISLQLYLLPALTDLHVQHPDGNLVTTFDECENVRQFTFTHPRKEHWASIHNLLLANNWPRRERVRAETYDNSLHSTIKVYVVQMKKLSQNIGFIFETFERLQPV
ncbi:hypothetical protein CROQUDRAFT_85952 [Cronartium quercuum f. sp. fusiforme G11]|uniref:Uncharacterized protein n=1 Tax=Cronartium quercuum f. sp. fusiforme G11 TaxID=708437 RepID=A0A9P6THZ1_9BASI|nr:hypothetical protein CROQUDRAFT_85952 [Cronartium quercuum f. sp. fusiforme G11]